MAKDHGRKDAVKERNELANPKRVEGLVQRMRRMSRRRFLDRLGQLGLSGAALAGISKEAVASNTDGTDKQVPRLFGYKYKDGKSPQGGSRPEREAVYYSIGRDEWIRTECARAAANRLEKEYESEGYSFGVTSSDGQGCVVAKYISHDYGDGETDEPNSSYEEFENQVPYQTDQTIERDGKKHTENNIPIIRRKETKTEDAYFDYSYRPVPGGCQFQRGTDGTSCTIGHPAFSNDLFDSVLVTASHCVERKTGVGIHQPTQFATYNKIGDSYQYTSSGDGDVATLQMDSDTSIEYDIASDSGGYMGWSVVGTVSSSSLDDMAANNRYAYAQGRTTGRVYDVIDDHYDKNKSSGPKVRIAAESDGGDSGGPYFVLDENNDAWRVGIHAWSSSTDNGDPARSGNTFYYAENKFNLQ